MAQDDLESLKGVLLGLGLTQLPKLLNSLHKSKELGQHIAAGRSSKGTNPDADALHSALAPLMQHLAAAGQSATQAAAADQPSPQPPSGPGMRPGAMPPSLPAMPALPRTMAASAGMGGF